VSVAQESCAALGCPMLGSFGVAGQWYCCCHFRHDAGARDAITSVLVANRALVDQVVLARRQFNASKEIEDQLINLTHEVGKQYEMGGNA
jgi:hypothetical protein